MEKRTIILIAIIILIIGILAFTIRTINTTITGEVISDRYTYTKAICNKTNFCQDYEISCNGNNLTDMTPITGAVIQHSFLWKDPRSEEVREKLC